MLACPECGQPAELEPWGARSSAEPVEEFVKIRCVGRHWFLLPRSQVRSLAQPEPD